MAGDTVLLFCLTSCCAAARGEVDGGSVREIFQGCVSRPRNAPRLRPQHLPELDWLSFRRAPVAARRKNDRCARPLGGLKCRTISRYRAEIVGRLRDDV